MKPLTRFKGVNFRQEFERLKRLPVFKGEDLTRCDFTLIQYDKPVRRQGLCTIRADGSTSIRVNVFDGLPLADALETLLHELTHAAVKSEGTIRVKFGRDRSIMHGKLFKLTLVTAAIQAGYVHDGFDRSLPAKIKVSTLDMRIISALAIRIERKLTPICPFFVQV